MIGNKEEIMSCLSTKNRGVARGQWGRPPQDFVNKILAGCLSLRGNEREEKGWVIS